MIKDNQFKTFLGCEVNQVRLGGGGRAGVTELHLILPPLYCIVYIIPQPNTLYGLKVELTFFTIFWRKVDKKMGRMPDEKERI